MPRSGQYTSSSASVTSVLARLLRYAKPYLSLIALATLFAVLFASSRYGRAYLLKPLLDDFILPSTGAESAGASIPSLLEASRHGVQLWMLGLAALLIIIVAPAALFGRAYCMMYAQSRISIDIQRELTEKLLRLPLSFHRGTSTGDTLARVMGDVGQNSATFQVLLADVVQALVMISVGIVTLFLISWQLATVSLVVAPAVAGVLAFSSGGIRRSARKRQEQVGEVTQRLVTILSGIKVIKAFRAEAVEVGAFVRETQRLFKRAMKAAVYQVMSRALVEMVNNGMAVGILALGTLLVLRGRWGLTAGDLVAFAGVLATAFKPLRTVANGWNQVADAVPSAERFFAILDTKAEVQDASDAITVDGLRDRIRFRNVSFSYGREPVLRNLDLEIRRGEVLAIVGRSGAGKTTLVDLLLRFYEPDSGSIEIDGIDLRRISRDSLLDLTALVTQEHFLFDASVRENIHYGRPDADDAAILAAAQTAHVAEFVDQLPDGYDTQVGEFGLMLSGGQRQRITIARAVLKDPAILFFDEATSSLDSMTERSVQDAIDGLRGRQTVVVIAHRLSTIRRADRIVVLDQGRVSHEGTHEELVAQSGLYRDLVAVYDGPVEPESRPPERDSAAVATAPAFAGGKPGTA